MFTQTFKIYVCPAPLSDGTFYTAELFFYQVFSFFSTNGLEYVSFVKYVTRFPRLFKSSLLDLNEERVSIMV